MMRLKMELISHKDKKYRIFVEMFNWLRERFTNSGKLTKAARNANTAIKKYGTNNSRATARLAAKTADSTSAATKTALDMAEKQLKAVQDRCSNDIADARKNVTTAKANHNKVKDSVFSKIRRTIAYGRNAWSSRAAAVNAQERLYKKYADKKKDELVELARKQKAVMEAEEQARKERQKIIESALSSANSAAQAATVQGNKNISAFKPKVNNANAKALEKLLSNNNNNKKNNNKKQGNSTIIRNRANTNDPKTPANAVTGAVTGPSTATAVTTPNGYKSFGGAYRTRRRR